jgi:hypothetical protein
MHSTITHIRSRQVPHVLCPVLLLPVVLAWLPPTAALALVRRCSKIVRKGIARVHTVYRQNIRTALRKKIENDGSNKKGKVRGAFEI